MILLIKIEENQDKIHEQNNITFIILRLPEYYLPPIQPNNQYIKAETFIPIHTKEANLVIRLFQKFMREK